MTMKIDSKRVFSRSLVVKALLNSVLKHRIQVYKKRADTQFE